MTDSTTDPLHAVVAVVFQVRDRRLAVLVENGALPGGQLAPGETLEACARRHVDARALAHLEQLETRSDPLRKPGVRELATAYLGVVPAGVSVQGEWHPVADLPPLADDHAEIVLAGRSRLRAKLSYTNVGFALA